MNWYTITYIDHLGLQSKRVIKADSLKQARERAKNIAKIENITEYVVKKGW